MSRGSKKAGPRRHQNGGHAKRAGGGSGEFWRLAGICVVIAALVWTVFGQTRFFPFINVDDNDYVFRNPMVTRGLTLDGFAWAFTHIHSANWHPLTWISHMIDCEFYGLNAGGHHLTNILLHAATAILLFLFLHDLTGALWRSAFVAALFAVHPLRVESVAWVAERKDLLSGLFFVLTLWAYVRYTRAPSKGRYLGLLAFFALGLMSKPMLVTIPFILLLLDYWPLNRMRQRWADIRPLVVEKLPLFGLALASALITLFGQQRALQSIAKIPLLTRAGNAVVSCAVYISEMIWPSCLAAMHPFVPGENSGGRIALAAALLAVISGLVFVFRRKRYLVTAWLWFLVMLGPVIGIVQVGIQAHADRYTYLPQIGLYLLVVWFAADIASRWRRGAVAVSVVGLAALGVLTWSAHALATTWQDSESLWRHAIACTSRNAPAEQNLGEALYEQGRREEAIAHYQTALEIDPSLVYARTALGVALQELGRADESLAQLEQAVRMDPNHADAHYNLGNTLLAMGLAAEAATHYSKAVEINPLDIEAGNNLAWILATCPDPAVRDGSRAVKIAERIASFTSNKNALVTATLAAAYAEAGRTTDAVRAGERAVQLALAEGNQAWADSFRAQLDSYKAGSPYRDRRHTPRTR